MQNRSAIPFAIVGLTIGISGIAWAGPHVVPLAVTACSSSTPCFSATNKSSGPAILGAAASGTGLRGASSGTAGVAGLYGNASGTGTGVIGISSTSNGVEGRSSTANGVAAMSSGNAPAVAGSASAASTGFAIEGIAPEGIAVESTASLQAFAGVGQFESTSHSGNLLNLINSQGITVFSVDQTGDLFFFGAELACVRYYNTTNSACQGEDKPAADVAPRKARVVGQPVGSEVLRVVRYGDAELIGGSARVPLEPAMAGRLVNARSYHVFLTPPSGSSSWLYVEGKSAAGFVVREHGPARSTGVFSYRIVADLVPAAASVVKGAL